MTRLLRARTAEVAALAALLAFTLAAVLGYWNFALHPDRLPASPAATRFFTISFQFFAQIHVVLAALALGVVLVGRLRLRWVGAAGLVYALSFLAEHVGTGYGIPFGGYGYTGLLGYKLGGRVPALIPLSWFFMAVPSWVLARHAMGSEPRRRLGRVAVGALWLTVWDLALDPAMSYLTAYWRWEESGPYYGMPWMNLVGWYVTGLVLMVALEGVGRHVSLGALPVRWMGAFWGVVTLMPLGMLVAAGAWLGVGVSLASIAGCTLLSMGLARRARPAQGLSPEPAPAWAVTR